MMCTSLSCHGLCLNDQKEYLLRLTSTDADLWLFLALNCRIELFVSVLASSESFICSARGTHRWQMIDFYWISMSKNNSCSAGIEPQIFIPNFSPVLLSFVFSLGFQLSLEEHVIERRE